METLCNGEQVFIRRGQCGAGWPQTLIWVDIASDAAIWLSYMVISAVLVWFLIKRRESITHRLVWGLFGAFIFLCGMTHAADVAVFFWPHYWLDAWVRVACAAVSIATVAVLAVLGPKIRQLPTLDDLHWMSMRFVSPEDRT